MKKIKIYTDNYRKKLDNLCKLKGFANANYFDKVKPFIPKSLKILCTPDTNRKSLNCHGYTFGTHRRYTPKEVFGLISGDKLKEATEPKRGDVILYIDETSRLPIIKHSGIYVGSGKVKSKWNTNGPVFEHDIFNIPFQYGNDIKFYRYDVE